MHSVITPAKLSHTPLHYNGAYSVGMQRSMQQSGTAVSGAQAVLRLNLPAKARRCCRKASWLSMEHTCSGKVEFDTSTSDPVQNKLLNMHVISEAIWRVQYSQYFDIYMFDKSRFDCVNEDGNWYVSIQE